MLYPLLLAAMLAQSATPPTNRVAPPQADQAEPSGSEAHRAQLDVLLRHKDYDAIEERLGQAEDARVARANLDWLGNQFLNGSPIYIAFTYARVLLSIASTLPDDQASGLRGTAMAALLYAASASLAEDRQCADQTAWGNRFQQLSQWISSSGLLELSTRERHMAATVALAIEQRSWERRQLENDAAFLCMNGMQAMNAGIAAGAVREAEPVEGQIGRQVKVTVPKGFVYERRDNAVWWPEAEAVRAQFPELLQRLALIEQKPAQGLSAAGSD